MIATEVALHASGLSFSCCAAADAATAAHSEATAAATTAVSGLSFSCCAAADAATAAVYSAITAAAADAADNIRLKEKYAITAAVNNAAA